MSYELKWTDDRGLQRTFKGSVMADDVLTSVLTVHGDPRFEKIRYIINDFTNITDYNLDDEDIKVLSAMGKAATLTNPGLKVAIVAHNSEVLNLGEFYCQRVANSSVNCQTFEDLEACQQWVKC
ncbi:MAG: hypothetical protein HUJ30_08640 [Gammaproteobacteria bacterium]|nr:hypothetical protein [Gammaproteobacteria bacterium]